MRRNVRFDPERLAAHLFFFFVLVGVPIVDDCGLRPLLADDGAYMLCWCVDLP
jgi:hypothetical protein